VKNNNDAMMKELMKKLAYQTATADDEESKKQLEEMEVDES